MANNGSCSVWIQIQILGLNASQLVSPFLNPRDARDLPLCKPALTVVCAVIGCSRFSHHAVSNIIIHKFSIALFPAERVHIFPQAWPSAAPQPSSVTCAWHDFDFAHGAIAQQKIWRFAIAWFAAVSCRLCLRWPLAPCRSTIVTIEFALPSSS